MRVASRGTSAISFTALMPKKPVSLRMNAEFHAAAKRRAKDLGMNSLADYIEALIGHDIAEGFAFQVTYAAKKSPKFKAIPQARTKARSSAGGSRRKTTTRSGKGRSTSTPN